MAAVTTLFCVSFRPWLRAAQDSKNGQPSQFATHRQVYGG